MKKNPAWRAGEKNYLASISSEKKFLARTKNPSPPPSPEYQMDRALINFYEDQMEVEVRTSISHINKVCFLTLS